MLSEPIPKLQHNIILPMVLLKDVTRIYFLLLPQGSRLRRARYIASHADLIQAFRYNLEAGSNHYLYSGRGEGRQITFSSEAYLSRYGDLQAAFGTNLDAATYHYITTGFNEGRSWI